MSAAPAARPCGSCPYRRDVPSGLWSEDEYNKLPLFDQPTPWQPPAAFFCHQNDGRLCAGWVGCHDMTESLGLRIAESIGLITREDAIAAHAYVSPVPLWGSASEAVAHGLRDLHAPGKRAQRMAARIVRKIDTAHWEEKP